MARNQGNLAKGVFVALGILVVVGGAGAAAYFWLGQKDGYADLPEFPVGDYLEGDNLWNYEEYRIEGRVDNVVYRSADGDVLVVSIQPEGSKLRLPVEIRRGPLTKPVQLENQLQMKVRIGGGRKIVCEQYASR